MHVVVDVVSLLVIGFVGAVAVGALARRDHRSRLPQVLGLVGVLCGVGVLQLVPAALAAPTVVTGGAGAEASAAATSTAPAIPTATPFLTPTQPLSATRSSTPDALDAVTVPPPPGDPAPDTGVAAPGAAGPDAAAATVAAFLATRDGQAKTAKGSGSELDAATLCKGKVLWTFDVGRKYKSVTLKAKADRPHSDEITLAVSVDGGNGQKRTLSASSDIVEITADLSGANSLEISTTRPDDHECPEVTVQWTVTDVKPT